MIFKNWLDTRPKMETHDPNVYPTILGGVSRGFWTPFLNRGAQSAIFGHLKTGTFAKSARFQVPKNLENPQIHSQGIWGFLNGCQSASASYFYPHCPMGPMSTSFLNLCIRGPSRLRLLEFVQIFEYFQVCITDTCQTTESFAKSVYLK